MKMISQEDSFTWALGDDLNCELCGPTYNEVGLELWDDEGGTWQLYIRVGCYEGDGVMSYDPEWSKKSAEIVEQATWYSGFSEDDAKTLRQKIEEVRGHNNV
jgi:hypothetical protein